MNGVPESCRAARAAGIHPVIGCEVYVCPDVHAAVSADGCSRLVLLCENRTGYRNLCKLVSESWTHCDGDFPRADWAMLEKYHEDLIALSAGVFGEVFRLLRAERVEEARSAARR